MMIASHFSRALTDLRLAFAAIAATLLSAIGTHGLQTHAIGESGFADFQRGELENMSINQHGRMEAAPALREVARLNESVVWAAVADADGNLFLGTGNRGRILKLDPEGEVEVIFEPDQILSRALAMDEDGNLYVGTSPQGAVYRIHPDRDYPELFFDPDGVYIWQLEIHDGALWVATGFSAELWRVPLQRTDGEPERWFRARDTHFTSMTIVDSGEIYLGSSPQGLIFEVTGKEEGFALSRAPDEEITAIHVADEGIYFSTASAAEQRPQRRPQGTSGNSASDTNSDLQSGGEGRSVTPPRAGRSGLYLREPNGFVSPVWQSQREDIGSLMRSPRGFWLVGLNQDGKLLLLQSRDEWSWLQRAPNGGEISVLMAAPDSERDVLVITSNPAAVYRLGGRSEEGSVYTSTVLDATQSVRWGKIEVAYDGTGPATVATRGGNTPQPDEVWSDWHEAESAGDTPGIWRGAIGNPPARFIQYRLTLDPGAGSGGIHQVRAFLQLPNVAPMILDLRHLPFGVEAVTSAPGTRPIDMESVFKADNPERLGEGPATRTQFIRLPDTDLRTFVWRAHDPNGDRMRFDVYLKQLDRGDWVRIESDLEESFTVVSLSGMNEGYYQLKVAANDRLDNSPADAGESVRISTPFLVDRHSPQIEVSEQSWDGARVHLEFRVTDEWSVIRHVRVRINGEPAITVLPLDGIFDSNAEEFAWEGSPVGRVSGNLSVLIEAVDESGNRASHAFSLPRR